MKLITAQDFKQFSFLSRLSYAPEGDKYAFAVSAVKDGDSYATNLWLGGNNTKPFPLTASDKDSSFAWEDATTILFSSARNAKKVEGKNKNTDFYRISTNGGEAQKAFSLPLPVQWIQPIAPNEYLLIAEEEMSRTDFSLPPLPEKEVADNWEADCEVLEEIPFWANGSGFTSGLRARLFIYKDSTMPILTPLSPKEVDVSQVKYHKESGLIYFLGEEFHRVGDTFNAIYRCSSSGSNLEILTPPKFAFNTFDFYNNQLVTLATNQKLHGLNQSREIFILDPEKKELTLLCENDRSYGSGVGTDSRMGGGITFKVWEDSIYTTMLTEHSSHLCKISLSDGTVEFLSPEGDSFDFFDINSNGLIASAFCGLTLAELYEYTNNTWSSLTAFHTEFHNNYRLSIPVRHSFTDKEGFIIDGWVMPPTEYKKGEKYPAILHIHGGPKTILGEVYHHEMQLWASRGYFVLFCNPRGSDGKGNAFSDIRGKYGTCDYENIMEFLETCLSHHPDIDSDFVGVTGGSYGGFMTNWIIGQTDRFKAAVTQRSISNWVSMNYISDIGYYFSPDQALAETWDTTSFDPERLWNVSPLKYAHKATTPTLLIHSDQDYRCPVPEGYQMFTALQLAGVETKMCMFRGETHELSRSGKPKNRLRRLNEICEWMDKYLKA